MKTIKGGGGGLGGGGGGWNVGLKRKKDKARPIEESGRGGEPLHREEKKLKPKKGNETRKVSSDKKTLWVSWERLDEPSVGGKRNDTKKSMRGGGERRIRRRRGIDKKKEGRPKAPACRTI